ncbi:TPA: hypothetical protein DEG21_03745 [Patescibacteria group bacterium]|nr:hypothetical protein [Candidatus Gracilibacteria bacterium]HBY74963.1 hypothetical protein [Candidatus Gracilibacteria bacterium]
MLLYVCISFIKASSIPETLRIFSSLFVFIKLRIFSKFTLFLMSEIFIQIQEVTINFNLKNSVIILFVSSFSKKIILFI